MLKLDQIKNELAFGKLGAPSVSVEEVMNDYTVGPLIKDARFQFIKAWRDQPHYEDYLDNNEAWWSLQDIFHKYIRKALAKQGIKYGDNTIRVGKKTITVGLNDSEDHIWYEDEFGENHMIDASYFVSRDDPHGNDYALASIMHSVIDPDQLLIDYLLYSDNLISEVKSTLRQVVMVLRNDIQRWEYKRYTLNELGLQTLMDGCNDLLNAYKEVA